VYDRVPVEPTRPLPETWSLAEPAAADAGNTAAAAERYQRGRAVRQLDIIGTEPEAAFDDIVNLAAHVCRSDIAGVSLVDGDREWLKAELGLGVRELPAVCEFTSLALRTSGLVVVTDTHRHPDLAGTPFVDGPPFIRSYVGVPLHSVEGIAIGALFVASTTPTTLNESQHSMLEGLGRQVEHLFELRQSLRATSHAHDDLARSQIRLQRILDAITQGVVVHAPDGAIEQANPAAQRILGLSIEQMRGRKPLDPRWQMIHRDGTPFPGDQHPASVTLRYGVAVHDVTFGVARPDGERRWVLVNSAPLPTPEDGGLGAVATFSDITDITELNDQLHESLRELAEAAQERAALLSAVSHDIRAPLASIRMMTEILEDRADAITTDQRSELIHRVRVEARRTEGVLADLVSANRVGTGLNTPRRQRVDLDQLVRSVAREFANDDHEVRVGELVGDLLLWADRAQIERILDNLISNAVRHTPAGSHVVVSAIERPEAIELSVSDDGPGVSDALKTRIFDAYVRGERSENRPGSGLGLYLVQQFAQFHGGRAWCEDAPDGGARFVVSLPRRSTDRVDVAAALRAD